MPKLLWPLGNRESLERKLVVAVVVTSLMFLALFRSLSGAFLKRFETAS